MANNWFRDLQKEHFAEDEVTTPALSQVFNRAFIKTTFDKDDVLSIHADDGVRYKVVLDSDRKMIIFSQYFSLRMIPHLHSSSTW